MRPTFRHSAPTLATATLVLVCLAVPARQAAAGRTNTPQVLRIRHFSAPDHTRIVLDLSAPATFEVRPVHEPERLAINVQGAGFVAADAIAIRDGLVERVRCNPGHSRAQVVLDLAYRTHHRAFKLAAEDGLNDRIVIDIFRASGDASQKEPQPPTPPAQAIRPFRVVLDPGHGGLDPGAVRAGIREKDIALAVSLEVAKFLGDLPGYEVVLTRSRDYYPSLGRRVEIAREQKGDLFLSIHCNTHARASVGGMEVYFLSLQGATDREAQELADQENAADLVGLAPGDAREDAVLSILMDLRMTQVLQQSSRLAESMLGAASRAGLPTRKVKQARFQVLRTLAMPAALVEMAYLTNTTDRRLLAGADGQHRMAAAIVAGVLDYRRDRDTLAGLFPASTWSQRYRVQRGDNLWVLAKRHGTTVAEITKHNNLASTSLRVGQHLQLPQERPAP